jgi:hypothetical protein
MRLGNPVARGVAAATKLAGIALAFSMVPAWAGTAPAGTGFAPMFGADYLAPFAQPAAINAAGDIVGRNPVWGHAFVVTRNSGYSALPCPVALTACHATDINDLGWIVGWGERTPSWVPNRTALLWRPSGAGYVVTRIGGSSMPAPSSAGATPAPSGPPAEAVAVNAGNQVLIRAAGFAPGSGLVEIWTVKEKRRIKAPGTVVDLSDAGWIAGNAELPYRLHGLTGELIWTELPKRFVGARAESINGAGEIAGAVFDHRGRSFMAATDESGTWQLLGGKGPADFAVSITDSSEVLGHAHGLRKDSHCAVRFTGSPLSALEDFLVGDAIGWVIGHEVGGMNNSRMIATDAVHGTSGLPALIRLEPTGTVRECSGDCLYVGWIELEKIEPPNDESTARYVATVQVASDVIWEPPTVDAEVTWILDGGRRVVRQTGRTDAAAQIQFEVEATAAPVDFYVTGLSSAGFRFDPTQGRLHAGR